MSTEYEIRVARDPTTGRDEIGSAMIRVRGRKDRKRDDMIDLVDRASETAYAHMLDHVPRSGPGEKNPKQSPQTIASSIDPGAPAQFSPGGAGGGGFWDRQVGFSDPPKHLKYVLDGVGPAAGHGSIRAHTGNIGTMTFRGDRGFVSPKSIRGREADREWLDDAFDKANGVLRAGIESIMNT